MNTAKAVEPQWVPTSADCQQALISRFTERVTARTGLQPTSYHELWQWSVRDIDEFWLCVWEYFAVSTQTPAVALAADAMPGARWFPGVQLNYAARVIANSRPHRPAIIGVSEDASDREISWAEMLRQAGALAATLRRAGVGSGDRVIGYLTNIPEAVIAFLATASIGAIWSACGQEYTVHAALDRLGQLDPAALIVAGGYRFGGKLFDRRTEAAALRDALPGLKIAICVPRIFGDVDEMITWDEATAGRDPLTPLPVDFGHPLWIVFSSGTTGLPKGIVHGHGGVILEHLKLGALHLGIDREDRFFWHTSTSWMMWNLQVGGLLAGATITCYDGSPTYPDPGALWEVAARTGTTTLGTSPGYVLANIKREVAPRIQYDLSRLRTVGVTGSTLPPAASIWLQDNLGNDVRICGISGGTDVVSAFIGGVPTVPVWPGELSAPCLGVAVDAYDEQGQSVRGKMGELVITAPMPSMPVSIWNDPDGRRYHDIYFGHYPGVWRHGDWITMTDHGTIIVHGRSDSTLNRNGIRMGSADIYEVVERLPDIAEALVLGVEQPNGAYWMPLFVVLAAGAELNDALKGQISAAIRAQVSPWHVPDQIMAAPGIPHTKTGKKLEVPIKRLLQGGNPSQVVDRSAVDNPELIDWFVSVPH
ncbi:MAG: acetoacetyl-CoA synthetase [Mycobacterium sp.]|nr:acetoacetyl-CoA synthetase [Mycobacterium sp.]MDT5321429.1 acetoacetyl-CoA synthetase [Mycobacterium sp.]MDT5356006.1 acetoacetyl-CoA synthetase [Mycobacterium sp.]